MTNGTDTATKTNIRKEKNGTQENRTKLKILNWNVEGLKSIIHITTEDIFNQFDICALTETFLTDAISTNIPGFYNIHTLARQGERGRPVGGLTCLLKPHMAPYSIKMKDENKLVIQTKVCLVIVAYFNPESTASDIIHSLAEALMLAATTDRILLCGDFNCPIDKDSRKANNVLYFLQEEGLTLINDKDVPTYVCYNGMSTIDLVFTRGFVTDTQNQAWNLEESVIRKHIPIVTVLKCEEITKSKTPELVGRRIDGSCLEKKSQEIRQLDTLITEGKLNEAIEGLNIIMKKAILQPTRKKGKKWFDGECYDKRKATLMGLGRVKKTRTKEALKEYHMLRREYKDLIKEKKGKYMEKEAAIIAEAAEEDPFQSIRARQPLFPASVPIEIWEAQTRKVLAQKNTRPEYIEKEIEKDPSPYFTKKEVEKAITSLKRHKAPGPDGICNEIWKATYPILGDIWLRLLNKCLETGEIPKEWRKATIKMLYKGKGDVGSPDAYRGIALEATAFKILTKMLTSRINQVLERVLPDEQFGFRRGRSALMAAEGLIKEIQEELRKTRGKMFVVFVDFSKAFDTVNRQMLVSKLKNIIGNTWTLKLISNILSENYVQVSNNIERSDWISQENGVLQGDPLSPQLFNVLTYDGVEEIKKMSENVSIYMYADDMALASNDKEQLQKGFDALVDWAENNDLRMNYQKTELVVFRKGGRPAAGDDIFCKGSPLGKSNHYKYLGVTIQLTGNSYGLHLQERLIGAIRSMNEIRNLQLLSLETAIRLFEAKVIPALTYGLEIIWEHLTTKQLQSIESIKSRFLKRTMGLSKYTPSRLVYVLARETFLIEDLMLKLLLPTTKAAREVLRVRAEKAGDIWEEFYTTDAMMTHSWKNSNQELRNVVTRLAVHGFHSKVCRNEKFHSPNSNCVCILCGETCKRYHLQECTKRTQSLLNYARE